MFTRNPDQDAHRDIAVRAAAWGSYTVQNWFVDGTVLIRLPFALPDHELLLGCTCAKDARDLQHYLDLQRSCLYVEQYRELTHADPPKHLEYMLRVTQEHPGQLVHLSEASEKIKPCPYPIRKALLDEGWMGVRASYLEAIAEYAYPDQWHLHHLPPYMQPDSTARYPFLVGSRRGTVVAVVPTVPMPGSAFDFAAYGRLGTQLKRDQGLMPCGHPVGEHPEEPDGDAEEGMLTLRAESMDGLDGVMLKLTDLLRGLAHDAAPESPSDEDAASA